MADRRTQPSPGALLVDARATYHYMIIPSRAAERTQVRYLDGWPRKRSKVNPFDIATRAGLRAGVAPLPNDQAGALHGGPRTRTALVSLALPPGHRASMCARLLGHHLIARTSDPPVIIDARDLLLACDSRDEWAMSFAAALLVPPGLRRP